MPALLSSPKEYFEALAAEKFLLFLDLIVFLGLQDNGADKVTDDLAVAWLEYGFNEQCIEMFYLLYAVSLEDNSPLQVYHFGYSFNLICSGFFVAQTIKRLGFGDQILEIKTGGGNVRAFLDNNINAQKFNDALATTVEEHNKLSFNDIKKSLVNTVRKLNEISGLFSHVDGYVNYIDIKVNGEKKIRADIEIDVDFLLTDYLNYIKKLELLNQGKNILKEPIDPLLHTRFSWVSRLSDYLRRQALIDDQVLARVAEMVQEIRLHHPTIKEEEFFLSHISPLPMATVVMKGIMRTLGLFGGYAIDGASESSDQSQEREEPHI